MELMTALFTVGQGMVTTIMRTSGLSALSATALPNKMVTIIQEVSSLDSIPFWAVTLLHGNYIKYGQSAPIPHRLDDADEQ